MPWLLTFADFSDTHTLSRVRLKPPKCQHLAELRRWAEMCIINSQKVVGATFTFFLKKKKKNKRDYNDLLISRLCSCSWVRRVPDIFSFRLVECFIPQILQPVVPTWWLRQQVRWVQAHLSSPPWICMARSSSCALRHLCVCFLLSKAFQNPKASPKFTADGDCSHEIKRRLLLGRKATTNLDSTLKSRDITLPTKVHLVKAMVFPVVMYGCESWTIKKAEHWRNDAFKLWCWRRLLRVSGATRRSNQSILKEISPEYSLEGLMLKLKLQYLATWCEELTHWKRPWCWERLKAGEGMTEDEMVG